ncbi:MAG: CapA family protein [Clostridiales bacterium]|nr:CapA family protein [Clostridiales bacterium]
MKEDFFLRWEMLKLLLELEKLKYRIIGVLKGDKYRYSQPVQGDFNDLQPGEFDWWKYKYYIRQIEQAEKGKHIEEFFAKQNLDFSLPEGFVAKGTFKMTAGGDLLSGDQITTETTKHLWDDIAHFYFENTDRVYANLETPIAASQPVKNAPRSVNETPQLNGTEGMLDRYLNNGRGINFFSTANNHCFNQGEKGLIETLELLDKKGALQVGTARTSEEQDNIPIIEKNGLRIAYIAYTFTLNGDKVPEGKEYMVNHVHLNNPNEDLTLIKRHVAIAREGKADMVIAFLHWSLEFESYPIENIIKMGHRILEECGVDIIIGNHAHVIQPLEGYNFTDPFSGEKKSGLIAYSLGNLVADFNTDNSLLSILLRIQMTKGTLNGLEKTVISGLEVLPFYTFKECRDGVFKEIRLLDFLNLLEQLQKGVTPYAFTKEQIKELYRLKKLFYKLMPNSIEQVVQTKHRLSKK